MSEGAGTVYCVEVTQALKYRIDVSASQEQALRSHVGGSRFAYNHRLALVKANWAQVRAEKEASGDGSHATQYVSTSHFGLLYPWAGVREDAAPWWGENSAQAYNDAAQRLAKAFANHRAGRASSPRFKRKGLTGSVKFSGASFRLDGRHHVRLSRIGLVGTYESMRKLARRVENGPARVVTATLKRVPGGWFLSFTVVVQRPDPTPPKSPEAGGKVIGVDLGLPTLVAGASPEGELLVHASNPRPYVRSQVKLAKAQKVASRRQGPGRGKRRRTGGGALTRASKPYTLGLSTSVARSSITCPGTWPRHMT